VDSDFRAVFPVKKGVAAVRAEEFSFLKFFEFRFGLGYTTADFAKHLRFQEAVVVVKILSRSVAARAVDMARYSFVLNRFKLFVMPKAIVLK